MREQWLTAIRSRLDGDNGPYALLHETALTEAVELFISTERSRDLWETCYLVGLLHFQRGASLGDERARAEVMTAMPLLSFAYAVRPEVPLQDPLGQIVSQSVTPSLIAQLDQAETDWERLSMLLQPWLDDGADPHPLQLAVAVGRNAMRRTFPGQPQRARYLAFLNAAQRRLFEQSGDMAVLDDAITTARSEAARAPADDPDRFLYDYSLAESLRVLFERTGDFAALRESVDLGRRVLRVRPDGTDQRYVFLLDHSTSARVLHQFTNEPRLLDEAIEAGAAAVELIVPEEPVRGSQAASALANYAMLLQARFDRTGDQPALNQAITIARRAEQTAYPDTPLRTACRYTLSSLLRTQFDRTGDLTALDEAVDVVRGVLRATPPEHPDAPQYQSAYVGHLRARFDRTGDIGDLDDAIDLGVAVVKATPTDHPNRPMYLTNLAVAMRAKAEHIDDPSIVDRAVVIQRMAVQTTVDSGDRKASMLSILGNVLATRYDLTGEDAALDEAVSIGRAAVATAGEEHPDRSGFELNLVASLDRRAAEHHDEMLDLLEAAALRDSARPAVRVEAATAWGRVAMVAGQADRAARGFDVAVGLLPVLAARGLTRADATHWMAQHSPLVCDAAACALEVGRADRAVELLELGRGVLMAQALESRTDLTDLREANPALAEEFGYLCRQLDSEDPDEERRDLAARLAALVKRVRSLPGFDRFLLPPTLTQLTAEAHSGPIVMVNVSQYRCDALILTESGVAAAPLTDLDLPAVHERLAEMRAAIDTMADPDAQHAMRDVLAWLRDTITGPVLDQVDPTASRLWWVPCGPLAYFPLHATVLDRVASSYTPTIRALAHARTRQVSRDGSAKPRVLAVAMPRTPEASDLPGAGKETELLGQLLPDLSQLANENATHDAVLSRLETSEWAHFACHATSNPVDPGDSHLLVHDHARKPLRVVEISRLNLIKSEFAYLSACDTATTSLDLVNESIHIASAFQLAGYPHVIGTLWEISDIVATKIAAHVYAELAAHHYDIRGAAFSLHEAIHMVRDRYPLVPTLWAAHIHVGP